MLEVICNTHSLSIRSFFFFFFSDLKSLFFSFTVMFSLFKCECQISFSLISTIFYSHIFFLSFTLSLFLSCWNHYHPHFLPSDCTFFVFQYQCISLPNIHIFCPSFSHLLSTLSCSLSLPLHETFIFLRYFLSLSMTPFLSDIETYSLQLSFQFQIIVSFGMFYLEPYFLGHLVEIASFFSFFFPLIIFIPSVNIYIISIIHFIGTLA